MSTFFISAFVEPDNKGIVSAATGELGELRCNIESSMMSILGDHFAMILVVSTDASRQVIERALTQKLGPVVVRQIDAYKTRGTRDDTHEVTVWTDKDQHGVMRAVSATLTRLDVNIVTASSNVYRSAKGTSCVMTLEVWFPAGMTEDAVEAKIHGALETVGIRAEHRHVEVRPQRDSPQS